MKRVRALFADECEVCEERVEKGEPCFYAPERKALRHIRCEEGELEEEERRRRRNARLGIQEGGEA